MNWNCSLRLITFFTATTLLFTACRKREATEADTLVNFETGAIGITAAENTATIKIKTTAAAKQNTAVVVKLTNVNATYGTDYTTTPAAANGEITLTIPSGNNEASFTINKIANTFYDGDEKIQLEIYSSAQPIIIGALKQLSVSFAELVANSSAGVINGGGATYPNKVFIDFSANRQTGVLRTNWDLGFYTGSDDFRVTLNSSTNMMAKQLAKNDLNSVTTADTIGFTTLY
jgi:hypothetical protein